MAFFILKTILSGLIIAAVSSIARQYPKWAALLTALPLITYLSLIWIYYENRDLAQLQSYVRDVLIWLFPGMVFFVALILLFRWRVPFVWSMAIATATLFGSVLLFNRYGFLK